MSADGWENDPGRETAEREFFWQGTTKFLIKIRENFIFLVENFFVHSLEKKQGILMIEFFCLVIKKWPKKAMLIGFHNWNRLIWSLAGPTDRSVICVIVGDCSPVRH